MKQFILAPDSFKGTMTAKEICDIQKEVILKRIPDAIIHCVPMADGGEGMTDAYLRILGGERVTCEVYDPLGRTIRAVYGVLPSGMAVMEMASSSGLPLVGDERDPMVATSYGVGQMLCHAKKAGIKKVLLGLGGSATNDCGIGMAAALGFSFLDASGAKLEPLAKNMSRIERIVVPDEALGLDVTAACDVDNPLYGETGATYTFGMQKGANEVTLPLLDAGLRNVARVIKKDLNIDVAHVSGAGAAGGLGAAVCAFLGGDLKPGIELMLDAACFDELLSKTDVVFTGEGRIDWQSAHGKVPMGVGLRCRAKNVACIALCGAIGDGAEAVYDCGITAMFSAVRGVTTFDELKTTCQDDMRQLTDSVLRLIC